MQSLNHFLAVTEKWLNAPYLFLGIIASILVILREIRELRE